LIVEGVPGVSGRTAVIPHGLDRRFFVEPRAPRPFEDCSDSNPFRWLYVSAIYDYKRPWNVAEAAARLRKDGGPGRARVPRAWISVLAPPPARPRSMRSIRRGGSSRRRQACRTGSAAHYAACDGFVFASTCENMPNSLLEADGRRSADCQLES
jgi:glycosyltransferase involved in cell wall biosynthesis